MFPAVWAGTQATVDKRLVQVVPLLLSPTGSSSGAGSHEGGVGCDLLWTTEQEASTIKENATQCKTLHNVIYIDSNNVSSVDSCFATIKTRILLHIFCQ